MTVVVQTLAPAPYHVYPRQGNAGNAGNTGNGGNAGNAGNAAGNGGNAGNVGNAGNAGNAAGNGGNAGNVGNAGNAAGNGGNAGNAGNAAGNGGNAGNVGNAGNAAGNGGNAGNLGNAGNSASNPQQSQSPQSSSSTLSIPQTAPAGGISFTQPAQTAAPSFYKIAPGEVITFGWNITSLFVTPTAMTVSAFCSENGNTYPVGPSNGVIPGSATEIVWDIYSYQTANPTLPLIVASYTLQVMDAHGLNAPQAPGRFAPNTNMIFALYSPQPYTPLPQWSGCAGCSGAVPNHIGHPLYLSMFVTFMAILFGGWGVFHRR